MSENAISESKALKLEPGRWKVSHVENKCKGPEAERNLKCLRKTSVNRENGVNRKDSRPWSQRHRQGPGHAFRFCSKNDGS